MSDWEADLARQRRNFEEASMRPARPQPESDPSLQMGNRGLITAILLAAAAGVAVIALGYLAVDVLVEVSDRAITPAQQFTAAFALATALGALVALVVNVRKQNLAEQLARREITAAFTERFRSAAQQLGGESPAERLAGVYAMAALADEYPTRRQQCVDVLCGYLRLPFDPANDHLADRSTTTTHVFSDGRTHTVHQNPASRPFDQQVRETIMAVIQDHTRVDSAVSWSALNFNLEGAHLSNVRLTRAVFLGGVDFTAATFSGSGSFENVTFAGPVEFNFASFSGWTSFSKVNFYKHVGFSGARFSRLYNMFDGATFSAGAAFNGATFSGAVGFKDATFTGRTTFDWATFSSDAWFDRAMFSGSLTFRRATFAGSTSFSEVTLGGDAQVCGLEDARLFDGAQITRDGEPFRGWPPVSGAPDESGG